MESIEIKYFLFIILIWYGLPFLVAVVLPAWIIPRLVKKFSNRKNLSLPSLKFFTLNIIGLAILANIFWEFVLYDRVYYEWDRLFLPYTLLNHEGPSLGERPNWIASGWKGWYLHVVWFVITAGIYSFSAFVAYSKNKTHEHSQKYLKVLITSVITLLLVSVTLPSLALLSLNHSSLGMPTNLQYEEVDQACVPAPTEEPQIFYVGDQEEWLSDLSGNNLRPAFQKHLQLKSTPEPLSPDGTKAALVWGGDLWVHCLHSKGAFKIALPENLEHSSTYEVRSSPSWSPDSKFMILNNGGDLLLLDLDKKKTEVVKNQVALIDNNVDITAKDRDPSVQPFEYGDAYWSRDDFIYYTAFINNTVELRKLNWRSSSEEVVYSGEMNINILKGSPDGKWLLVTQRPFSTTPQLDNDENHIYLFNTQDKSMTNAVFGDTKALSYKTIFSPSSSLIATSNSSWQTAPVPKGFPALVYDLDSAEVYSITPKIETWLKNRGVDLTNKAVVVEIIDFVDDETVLVKVQAIEHLKGIPYQLNGLFHYATGELTILQEYPATSFDENRVKRIEPFHIIERSP